MRSKPSEMTFVSYLLLTFILAVTFVNPLQAEEAKITFLHSNDMGEMSGKPGYGGFPEMATLIDRERGRVPGAITTFGGDLISPSLMSGLSHGVEMVDMMNAIGIDIAVLGNHEFDFGPDVTRDRVAQSKFPWLASNLTLKDGVEELGTSNIFIKEVQGYKVGFLGLLTPETATLSSPGDAIAFEDVVTAANTAIASLTEGGAEIIVALTHMDLADDVRLAREAKGLHVILGGHDHRTFASVENDVVILQAGSDLRYLGIVDLVVDWKEKRGKKYLSIIPSWQILATAGVAPSAKIYELVASYEKDLDAQLDVAVGQTEIALDSRRASVRTQSSELGEFIAMAMKTEVKADIGFTNGGGIRGDRQYEAGTILTRKDILKELPFGNVTVKLAINGAHVRELVEHGVSKVEDAAGRFAHYAGLNFEYDVTKPEGQRVTSLSVNGAPVDPSKIYTLATNDYVAGGGDGFGMLPAGKVLIDKSAGTLMATTVMNYIKLQGGIKKNFAK